MKLAAEDLITLAVLLENNDSINVDDMKEK